MVARQSFFVKVSFLLAPSVKLPSYRTTSNLMMYSLSHASTRRTIRKRRTFRRSSRASTRSTMAGIAPRRLVIRFRATSRRPTTSTVSAARRHGWTTRRTPRNLTWHLEIKKRKLSTKRDVRSAYSKKEGKRAVSPPVTRVTRKSSLARCARPMLAVPQVHQPRRIRSTMVARERVLVPEPSSKSIRRES